MDSDHRRDLIMSCAVPKTGRRGVMEAVVKMMLTHTVHPMSSHTLTQNHTAPGKT